MEKEKTIAESTDDELEREILAIKYAHFKKWSDQVDTAEAKAELQKIAEYTGYKIGSPILMIVVAFFAGIEAGVEIMEGLSKETKSPASAPTLTGQPLNQPRN